MTTQSALSLADLLHFRAVEVAARYKRLEAELIDILQEVEDHRVFIRRGHASLFSYVISELGLGENIAYTLITVSRKAREVPELKSKLKAGAITLSNARRVASVLTPQNKDIWIKKASDLSSRALEKEIVKIKPALATRERASYVTPDRVRLELGLSEREMLKLRRVQDLLSQKKRRVVSLEETINIMTDDFLTRHDPVAKAKRHQVRRGAAPESAREELSSGVAEGRDVNAPTINQLVTCRDGTRKSGLREPIPAAILHQVNLRDERRCAHVNTDGGRCNQQRWVEVHHKIPIAHGGTNALENLITLCSSHHRYWHLQNLDTYVTSAKRLSA